MCAYSFNPEVHHVASCIGTWCNCSFHAYRHSIYGSYLCVFNLQADLEKSKADEVSKLKEALHEMEQRVEEVKAMQEQESAKKAVEEALAQEREKISLLTTEIEGLKACSSSIIFCFVATDLQA